ncbi:hypothetical protein MUBE_01405 [Mycobacterium uberis]|uniref:Uncharacterized protein n=1 Tax=Mycobacterium uberis TaxID=2162698 RepID=A0A3E1HLQ2_9MYCO|nr:hypothetical protein MUBE_01405 [Mycobacterium uberis]
MYAEIDVIGYVNKDRPPIDKSVTRQKMPSRYFSAVAGCIANQWHISCYQANRSKVDYVICGSGPAWAVSGNRAHIDRAKISDHTILIG